MRQAALLLAAAASAAAEFTYGPAYSCPVCLHITEEGLPCERFGACDAIPPGTTDCVSAGHCTAEQKAAHRPPPLRATAPPSVAGVRVSKGFGTRDYPMLRLSLITDAAANVSGFDYSAPFKYKWTDNAIHTKLVPHPNPGKAATFDLGGISVSVRIPAQGDGTAGLLIGDPCVKASAVGCTFASKFQTDERTPVAINTLGADKDLDWWGILGDNFYDRYGTVTQAFFNKLNLTTLSKPMLTVPGNHDYWVLGSPLVGEGSDQYATGHMQWYAQDAKAAQSVAKGAAPFDFSVTPKRGHLPDISNSFWYNQMGNAAIIGWSGAYSLDTSLPLMKEACAWLGANRRSQGGSIDVAFLVGHWDTSGLGASSDMAGPGFYDHMKVLPGCDALDKVGMLKFVMGHTHCNVPHPHGKIDTGFMVAGQGMGGCGNYGWPIFDTTEGRVRVWHFETYSKDGKDTFDEKMQCIKAKGWRQCTAMADKWLDQPIQQS